MKTNDARVEAAISHWAPRFVANSALETPVIEDGNHVANNRGYRNRPQCADWMARQLGGRTS